MSELSAAGVVPAVREMMDELLKSDAKALQQMNAIYDMLERSVEEVNKLPGIDQSVQDQQREHARLTAQLNSRLKLVERCQSLSLSEGDAQPTPNANQ